MSDPAPPFSPGPAEDPSGERQVSTPLAILLAVVVGLALLYALWTFVIAPLMEDDDEVADAPTEQAGTEPGATPGATPEPTASATPGVTPAPVDDATPGTEMMMLGQPVPETFEIFTARDPFQQLIIERPAGGADADGDADEDADADADADPDADAAVDVDADVAVVVPPPTAGDTSGQPDADATPDADADPDADDPTSMGAPNDKPGDDGGDLSSQHSGGGGEFFTPPGAGTTEVTLVGPTTAPGGEPALLVAVGEEEHEVVEGEVFAERFWLLDIDGSCATFLFGDSRFTLCEGDTILK